MDHTEEEALAGGKRNPAERAQTLYVDKLRTFIENHLKSQIETQYPLHNPAWQARKAKEGKERGKNLRKSLGIP